MTAVFAPDVDAARFGEHRRPADRLLRFADPLPSAQTGRFHLYGARLCPASHRLAILLASTPAGEAVTMSWVHGQRDARGWAFRPATGADPVNGFTLLREAYEASAPGYAGPVTVPALWDRDQQRLVSNTPTALGVDLLRTFGDGGLYPDGLADGIERAGSWIVDHLSSVVGCAVYRPETAREVRGALRTLDRQLADQPFLLGDRLTDADVRLWVGLVRYDAGPNAHGAIGPHLDAYPNLWRYARELYARPAFQDTTDFGAFTAPYASVPRWDESV